MKTILMAAMLALPQPGFSPADEKPCLSRAEAADMGAFFMPAIIDGVARKCSAALPGSAFLKGAHRPLTARLRQEQPARWPRAKAAIEKIGGKKMPSLFGEEFVQKMAEATVTGMALQKIGAKDCGTVSEVLGTIAPLPAANFGRLFALLMEAGAAGKAEDRPFRICEGNGA